MVDSGPYAMNLKVDNVFKADPRDGGQKPDAVAFKSPSASVFVRKAEVSSFRGTRGTSSLVARLKKQAGKPTSQQAGQRASK